MFDADATRVSGGEVAAHSTLPNAQGAKPNEARQVGRYQVMQRIGRGGMANVFRAHDPGIDSIIAIKFLHSAYNHDEEYRGRFLREARAAGKLSHPNIVTVHDVGEIEGRVSFPGSAQQTQFGGVLGTPQFMSPEPTKGAKVDGRCDASSVGIILYQMLSGQAPFQGDSVVSLAMKISDEEPVPLDKPRPEIPQTVRRIVEHCLA